MTRILKIGGSILTDKSQELKARPDVILRLAMEISERPEGLVLVHGAGSFGHIPAKRWGLPLSFSREGLRETHSSVCRLTDMILDALAKAGVESLPVHPLSCLLLRDGRIDRFFQDGIREMLKDGIVPVLHGDVAMDSNRGAGIVSGDQLVAYLAVSMMPEVVALGSDVDGVLVSGRPLSSLIREELSLFGKEIGASAGVDVTGGMRGKLEELLDLADRGIESVIFNAGTPGNVPLALSGQRIGTRIWRGR